MSQKVVIIGGGYAGVQAAKGCDSAFDVTLIAGRDTFHHDVGGMRASVVPGYHARISPTYDNLLKRGRVMKCEATKIDPEAQTVTVSANEDIPYDVLILATGVLHPNTGKAALSDRIAVFEQANSEISLATDILVVGGGPIGIEMAGEIKEAFPDKKITLVTSQELMHSPDVPFPDRFRERLRAKLESLEVTVHTGVGRVSLDPSDINECGFIPGKKVYKWDGGEMEADLCIVATGSRQVPPLYQDSGLGEWINERGYIKVDNAFEVKGVGARGKVFAIGDCTDLPLAKMAYTADLCGVAVVKNVTASLNDTPLKDLVPSVPPMSVVPVGSTGGVSLFPMGIVAGDFITKMIKSKGLFCSKFWAVLNAGTPPTVP